MDPIWQLALHGGALFVNGAILIYIVMKRDPASAKEAKDERMAMFNLFAAERDKDRVARHDTATVYQTTLTRLLEKQTEESRFQREAFAAQISRFEDAFRIQTAELRGSINESCRFEPQVRVTGPK